MKTKNFISYLKPALIILAAFVGFYLIIVSSEWQKRSLYDTSNNETQVELIILGLVLMTPLAIYLYTLKPTPKTVLRGRTKSQRTDLISHRSRDRKKAKRVFNVYIRNETTESLIVDRKSILKHDQWYIFELKFEETLYFNNGITVEMENEELLEIHDFRNQIIGISKDEYRRYDIPDYVDFALIIAKQNEGNPIE